MKYQLCLNCFQLKGDYEVCPYCGHVEGGPAKSAFQLRPGTILQERYIIGEVLGYGGFGITYRAFDTMLGIVVAVKEFYPAGLVSRADGETKVSVFSGSKMAEYQRFLSRFIEEARNMALFSKEKDIVNVYAYFEANGTAYIIMEYVNGILLKTWLKENGRMQEEQACTYMCEILEAVQKIHERGIIHRDISPDNIFLIPDRDVKVFDFGAAKFEDGDSSAGLPAVVKSGYAPPEQYRAQKHQDYRVDIYAAGAVFYQMLTGEKPVESLERCEKDELKPPSQKKIPVRSHVEKALMKALSLEADGRFATAEEFRNALLKKKEKTEKRKGWRFRLGGS